MQQLIKHLIIFLNFDLLRHFLKLILFFVSFNEFGINLIFWYKFDTLPQRFIQMAVNHRLPKILKFRPLNFEGKS